MAVYFNLTRKSAPEAGPVVLNVVDAEICTLVGQSVHKTRYCLGWFDAIGFWLASGENWAQVRERHTRWRGETEGLSAENEAAHNAYYDGLAKILDWLETNFTVECWGR
jgi:hypothetical protein